MSKKKENAAVTVYTLQRTKLSQTDVDNFNAQYPKLDVKYTKVFHDRFLILDKMKAYHVVRLWRMQVKNVLELIWLKMQVL